MFFDVSLKVAIIAFLVWHWVLFGSFGMEMVQDILRAQSSTPEGSEHETGGPIEFLQHVSKLQARLRGEALHRSSAEVLGAFCVLRGVAYFGVHPRLATMYRTMLVMIPDMAHFLFIFANGYWMSALIGYWCFSDHNPNFSSISTTIYTQFRMLLGEFGLPEGSESGMSLPFMIYCTTYFIGIFLLLLNLFLEIVIDSYTKVKNEVDTSLVTNSVFFDMAVATAYPIVARLRGWPSRIELLSDILAFENNWGADDQQATLKLWKAVCDRHLPREEVMAITKHFEWVAPGIMAEGPKQARHILSHKSMLESQRSLHQLRLTLERRAFKSTPQPSNATSTPSKASRLAKSGAAQEAVLRALTLIERYQEMERSRKLLGQERDRYAEELEAVRKVLREQKEEEAHVRQQLENLSRECAVSQEAEAHERQRRAEFEDTILNMVPKLQGSRSSMQIAMQAPSSESAEGDWLQSDGSREATHLSNDSPAQPSHLGGHLGPSPSSRCKYEPRLRPPSRPR